MECEKVRNQFSSFVEKELSASEEEIVRKHIANCSECREDLKRFEKTVLWLHSVEEVEVPDGFLSGIYEKRKESEKKRWSWFGPSLRLPVQAAGMVTIALLVIYLTKMMPVETWRVKEVRQAKATRSAENKREAAQVQKEAEKEVISPEPSLGRTSPQKPHPEQSHPGKLSPESPRLRGVPATPPLKDTGQISLPPPLEGEADQSMASQTISPLKKEVGEESQSGTAMVAKGGQRPEAKPPKEVILKISDREKVINQINELVEQFGGEIVTAEENVLLASLPVASFQRFERDLAEIISSAKSKKLSPLPAEKRREFEQKGKEEVRPEGEREARMMVRILLIQE